VDVKWGKHINRRKLNGGFPVAVKQFHKHFWQWKTVPEIYWIVLFGQLCYCISSYIICHKNIKIETKINFNLIGCYIECMYVIYVSYYFDMFYILWPVNQKGYMEFEIKWKWKWKIGSDPLCIPFSESDVQQFRASDEEQYLLGRAGRSWSIVPSDKISKSTRTLQSQRECLKKLIKNYQFLQVSAFAAQESKHKYQNGGKAY
jgi:hypothetical protein